METGTDYINFVYSYMRINTVFSLGENVGAEGRSSNFSVLNVGILTGT